MFNDTKNREAISKQKTKGLVINTKDNNKKHLHEFEWQGRIKYKNKGF